LKRDNTYRKQRKRKHCRRRAAIEPIIGHIKSDHRAAINYLKGQMGDKINFIMSASGFNYKKLMTKLRVATLWLYTKLDVVCFCQVYSSTKTQISPLFRFKVSF